MYLRKTGMMQLVTDQAGEISTVGWKWKNIYNSWGPHHHGGRCSVMSVRGCSGGRQTRHDTSVLLSARSLSVSSVVRYSVQPANVGSRAREAWQCIGAALYQAPIMILDPALSADLIAETGVEPDQSHSRIPPYHHHMSSASNVSAGSGDQAIELGTSVLKKERSQYRSSVEQYNVENASVGFSAKVAWLSTGVM